MPEGHTLRRLALDLNNAFDGQPTKSSSPQGRFAAEAGLLDGRTLIGADAIGKHLLVEFSQLADVVHIHLGLYGSLKIGPAVALDEPITGQIRWRLDSSEHTATLRGPNTCELLNPAEVDALLDRLGPDPLRGDADPDRAWRRIKASTMPIATLLMDQKVVAGVGNVFRAEVLFRHGIAPMTAGRRIPRVRWNAMWSDLTELMQRGVELNRIVTVERHHGPDQASSEVRPADHGGEVYVYRREGQPCLVCHTPIAKKMLAGRNLFWCPSCQSGRTMRQAVAVGEDR